MTTNKTLCWFLIDNLENKIFLMKKDYLLDITLFQISQHSSNFQN